MPDNSIDDDFELLEAHLDSLAGVVSRSGLASGEALAAAERRAAGLVEALQRIRAAWPKAVEYPLHAPKDAILDCYKRDLGDGAVHTILVGYPGQLHTAEDAYSLSRRQGEALHELANALEVADAGAIAEVYALRAARGEPS